MNSFNYKKKYGQNFLTDKNLLAAIVMDAGIDKNDCVLEIGAGAGALTEELAKIGASIVAYEIDNELEAVLNERLKGFSNVSLVFDDFMKSFKGMDGEYKVCANLPYYITTPVLFKLLEAKNPPLSITIMVQREVGQRLTALKGTADYGAVTAMTAFYGTAVIKRIVPAAMFFPRPNVDSCVVRIDRTVSFQNADRERVSRVVRAAFAMRRKTLANNLVAEFHISKQRAGEIIQSIGLDANIRGEMLDITQFHKLSLILD